MRFHIIARHQEPDPATPRGRRRIRRAKVNVWRQYQCLARRWLSMAEEYTRRFLHDDMVESAPITWGRSWIRGKTLNVEVTVSLPGELTAGELHIEGEST